MGSPNEEATFTQRDPCCTGACSMYARHAAMI